MIYMDNAATTQICPAATKAMMPYLNQQYGNASARYGLAFSSRNAIEKSRKVIARAINASPEEIYFTSGGTESDNWAIKSVMLQKEILSGKRTPEIITSSIEHKAVLNTCKFAEKYGIKVIKLGVDNQGFVSVRELEKVITSSTKMISIMMANNEIGTIEPVRQIGMLARARGVIFHTDAVQAFGHISIDVKEMNIDMLSASGHKFGAPKGCGFLYISKNIDIEPYVHGGAQEAGKRSGTENVAGIVAMGAAADYSIKNMVNNTKKIIKLKDHIIKNICQRIDGVNINGSEDERLPGNISLSIDGIVGAAVVEELNRYGVCISAGSACSEGKGDPSHVLTAIGLSKEAAIGTIRITINEMNTLEEAEYLINKLVMIVSGLRVKHRKY